jgi:ArsR family transcriptional regulator
MQPSGYTDGHAVLTQQPIFADLTTLADATRSRMLLLLDHNELTVSELCAVLQLPQSTVSRHLKTLLDAGWVASRREATSRYYTLAHEDRDPAAERLWTLLREQVGNTAGADQDARRLKSVLGRRQSKSQAFFESAAGQWDLLREELFGRASHLQALPALLDPSWIVGDLGCGTGQLAAALAPFVARVVAVDRSGEMLQAARRKLREHANVEVRRGELEGLPIAEHELDAATLMLVLHHVADPSTVLREAARVLKPGGRLLICDMLPHDREEYRQQMGHVWLGFHGAHLQGLLADSGFTDARVVPMPSNPDAKGPSLFVASAVNRGSRDGRNSKLRSDTSK